MNATRRLMMVSGCSLLLVCATSDPSTPPPASPSQTATQPAAPAPTPAAVPAAPAAPASAPAPGWAAADEAHRNAEAVLKSIAGKENLPASQVFQDIEVMKDVPAGRMIRIMENGFAKALGVGCDHCHVVGRYESDEKRPKLAARDMMGMVGTISETLRSMKNLKNPQPSVTCTTCHRGQVTPATKL